MMKFILGILCVSAMGCASTSTPNNENSSEPQAKATDTATTADDGANEPSKILTRNKKCPKNSKVVNGKCTLQVESDE